MISIIVPVFNTEKYLKECIDSILRQSLAQIELILVDDGSTDNSGRVCDEYADIDKRVRVIHQENKGRVLARKCGLQNALFDYVMFFDSDDWIEENMCEEMMKLAIRYQADLVTSGYIREDGKVHQVETDAYQEGLYHTEAELEDFRIHSLMYRDVDCCGMIQTVWTKLYRRDLAIEVLSQVPDTLYRGEDLLFNNLYLMRCRSVYVSKAAYYHYRIHSGSTVNRPTPDFISQIGMTHKILKEEALKLPYKETYLYGVNMRAFLNFLRLWNENQSEMHIPYHCFSMENLGTGKMVLYGAGKVGRDYYELLHKLMPNKVVLWVDRACQEYDNRYKICPVEAIRTVDYEQVLIAVKSEEMAKEIRQCLVEEYHIPDKKIIWQPPDCFWL